MTNTDEGLQKASKDMQAAEDALAATGFPEEQWMLIKQYVLHAVYYHQLVYQKQLEEQKANAR
jgi:hypothetical protein